MLKSITALLLVASLVASTVSAQTPKTAEATVRETLRISLGEMDVSRTYRILVDTLRSENGMDITTAHAVPRTQIATAVYQATFRKISGPAICVRFKVSYDDDAYHDPQFVQSNSVNHLIAVGTSVPLIAVWGTIEGQSFNSPRWRLGYWIWDPAASGDRPCDASAPSDLDAWIASRQDNYPEFRRSRP